MSPACELAVLNTSQSPVGLQQLQLAGAVKIDPLTDL